MQVRWVLPALGAFLVLTPGGAADAPSPGAVDPGRDPRLAVKLELRSRGIPVSRVLSAIQRETGVSLSAAGKVGDERLVAFERGASLATVMGHLADLYRLRWTRETQAGKLRYRLEKPSTWEREEQALRSRALREVFTQLAQSLRAPAGGPAIPGRREQWQPLFPEVLPLLAAREAELIRQGYVYLPAGRLGEPVRGRLLEKLTPVLKKSDEERTAALLRFREEEIARGIPADQATADKPPSRPENSTVTAELYVDRFPRATAGLRTDTDTWYSWVFAGGDDLCDEGTALYADRKPRGPGGSPAAPPAGAADRFERMLPLPVQPPIAEKDWIGALERLADTAGIGLYTDCYHYFNHGLPGPPRGGFSLPQQGSVAQVLDRLCRPVENSGTQILAANSFWWRRGDTALVRSRNWLWETPAVLPADLLGRLGASMARHRTVSPADLAALAELEGLQVQSLGAMGGQQDFWLRGIRVPARLSLASRQALLGDGVTWGQLAPAERALAASLLSIAEDELPPTARARISAKIRNGDAQGAPVLALTAWPFGQRGGRHLQLPLPGYVLAPELRPQGPVVRVVPAQ